jgi:hypothetical protein
VAVDVEPRDPASCFQKEAGPGAHLRRGSWTYRFLFISGSGTAGQ